MSAARYAENAKIKEMMKKRTKLQINMTDSREDLDRFPTREDLCRLLDGFDGIELMHLEKETSGILTPDMVVGYHTVFPEYWMDFWRDDQEAYRKEFDTPEKAFHYYGGNTPEALIRKIRTEYENAISFGAEYAVIHVSDAGIFEEITGKYKYTDAEVIGEFSELVNEALEGLDGPWLLLENLWQPGLTFCDPDITARLMESITYPKKGIMLDTGHLMHTEPSLRTQKEAVSYIHRRLDEHGSLCRCIKGVHLHQSVTGAAMRHFKKSPPVPAATYEERLGQLFDYVFRVDLHRPFTAEGVTELIERIDPDYLTFELISRNLEEHEQMLKRQRSALKKGTVI